MAEAKESKEQKWSCGCHEVDGELVVKCTGVQPQHEMLAHHNLRAPYSKVCFRDPARDERLAVAEPEPEPEPVEVKPARKKPTLADFDEDTK
jgi:hypothetical protein